MEFHFLRIINLVLLVLVLFYCLEIEDVRWLSWMSRKHDFILAGCWLRFILLLPLVTVWTKNFWLAWITYRTFGTYHIYLRSLELYLIWTDPEVFPFCSIPLFLPITSFCSIQAPMRDGEKRGVKYSNRLLHIETLRSGVSFEPKDSKTVPLYVSTIKFYYPSRPGPGQQGKGRKRGRDILSPSLENLKICFKIPSSIVGVNKWRVVRYRVTIGLAIALFKFFVQSASLMVPVDFASLWLLRKYFDLSLATLCIVSVR